MLHPYTELRFIDHKIGYGVVAIRLLPRGTITWVRDDLDQVFSAIQVKDMTPIYRDLITKYAFVDARGDFVLCWDLARYLNHACEPSCMTTGYEFDLAVRDIQPGEELTADYASLNLEYDFTCACGSAKCRKLLRRGDFLRYVDSW
ncbi:MAG: SET domain-containing protein-lysine N-methyltransferase, partial [Deltaproteobacteria bacterium]|nr:SET domain-containing protein-lysine N-methyltransferase [Deltaproteobacteria bacterium]